MRLHTVVCTTHCEHLARCLLTCRRRERVERGRCAGTTLSLPCKLASIWLSAVLHTTAEAVDDFSAAIEQEPRFHDFHKRRGQALMGAFLQLFVSSRKKLEKAS